MAAPDLDRVALLLRAYPFADLSPAEVDPLARHAVLREAVRGEYVCRVGDPVEEIYLVASGQLKDSIVTEDGDEVVHTLWGPGMVLGEPGFFAPEHTRVVALVALEPCSLLLLTREHLMPFLHRHPQVMLRLLEGLASTARLQTQLIASLARRPLPERLLFRLLDLTETNARSDTGEAITPKVSQTVLASMVGSSRENVNRALAGLAAQGSIRIESGRYVVLDPDALRSEAALAWPPLTKRNRRID